MHKSPAEECLTLRKSRTLELFKLSQSALATAWQHMAELGQSGWKTYVNTELTQPS